MFYRYLVQSCQIFKSLIFFKGAKAENRYFAIFILGQTLQGLENTGKDCWNECHSKQGHCAWCGSKGMCCTKKTDWTDKSNGCDGTFGGKTLHECVLKQGKNILLQTKTS